MKIALGCDHAGLDLKEEIKSYLSERDLHCIDYGTDKEASVDYPDFGKLVSHDVSSGKTDKGILICGTGIGMSIVANKFSKVRAALCYDLFTARMSRMHNNANILVLGSRVTGKELALSIVRTWLATEFEGARHDRRIRKISELEGPNYNGNEVAQRN